MQLASKSPCLFVDTFLGTSDPMIQETMTKAYEDAGIIMNRGYKGFRKVARLDATPASKSAYGKHT
jgi:glutathione reductase (NADPH)